MQREILACGLRPDLLVGESPGRVAVGCNGVEAVGVGEDPFVQSCGDCLKVIQQFVLVLVVSLAYEHKMVYCLISLLAVAHRVSDLYKLV